MSKKQWPLTFAASLLLAALVLLVFPAPRQSLAANPPSCAPGRNSTTNPNRVQLYDGFLSVTTTDIINQISISDADKYICGYKAIIPQFAIPSFKEFKNTYYDQAKASAAAKKEFATSSSNPDANQGNLDFSGGKDILYHIKNPNASQAGGNLVINGPISATNTVVFFVDGNLTINNNIDTTVGVVFVVNGFIHVRWDVTQINALMMSYGQFCSGWYNDAYGCSINFFKDRLGQPGVVDNPRLILNGSVVALSSTDAAKPAFVRYLRDNITPAEEVNYQAKYLVILRKIFSRTRIIYTAFN